MLHTQSNENQSYELQVNLIPSMHTSVTGINTSDATS